MSEIDKCCEECAFIIGLALGAIACVLVWIIDDVVWKRSSVKQGYAHYDQITGYWTWGAAR